MRLKTLQGKLLENGLDLAVMISLDENPNTNLAYFAGYSGLGVLAVTKRSQLLLVPEMEFEKAKLTGLKVYKTQKKKFLFETLGALLRRHKIRRIGIEENRCTLSMYKALRKQVLGRYKDISTLCSKIRMVKSREELASIKKACSVTDSIFSEIATVFNFRTEEQLRNYILRRIEESGCTPAFPPIVASGIATSQAHYDSNSNLKKGFLMLDFGARYKGYCSDMTRMLYLGKPSRQELADFDLVLKTIDLCEAKADKTKYFGKLYDLAVETLGAKAEFFTHALGHGLGLDIHELPNLYTTDKTRIQENIPFTIEPGIYLPGKYGIRIEDTLVMMKGRLVRLTRSQKKLAVI